MEHYHFWMPNSIDDMKKHQENIMPSMDLLHDKKGMIVRMRSSKSMLGESIMETQFKIMMMPLSIMLKIGNGFHSEGLIDLHSCPGETRPPPPDRYGECWGEIFELWLQ